MNVKTASLLVSLFLCLGCTSHKEKKTLELWYDAPAKEWMQSLPVGNGRLGAMVFGGLGRETIALNESTLWSGEVNPNQETGFGKEKLAEIRNLFFQGKIKEGNELASKYLVGDASTFGSHLPFGDLVIEYDHETSPSNYRRSLDLRNAIAKVDYTVNNISYTREVFCSNPDRVLVIHLKANKKNSISFKAGVNMMREADLTVLEQSLQLKGKVDYPQFGKGGVEFASIIQINPKGGSLIPEESSIRIKNADEVTILIDINTTLFQNNPLAKCRENITNASQKKYETLRKSHTEDFSNLFNRVEISLGESNINQPTDVRLAQLKKNIDDPDLMALFAQYGRYLLISSSREDSPLPANLQGIWNDNLACTMAWTCDYHLDINTQQNYWLANIGNLPECNAPLFDFIDYLSKAGGKTAEKVYGSPGWVAHTVVNVWGYTSPGYSAGWGLHPTAGVWMATHLWEHYLYTRDKEFLQSTGYPLLKGAAMFMLDYMAKDPNGYLMSGPSTSPENSFLFDGGTYALSMMPTCDMVLTRELFTACISASKILDCDESFRNSLRQALDELPPFKIGKYGQLQEWFEDYEEAVPNHRHTSHLLALHPFAQISVSQTPELAKAAAKTIERRVSLADWEDVEWSRANLINYYARLKEPEKAFQSAKMMLTELSGENMLTISPKGIGGSSWDIFIFDGNQAGAAGITEMLLQSQENYIELLPALPSEWHTGYFKGLCARGGAEIDAEWENGIIGEALVKATVDNIFQIKIPGKRNEFNIRKDRKEVVLESSSDILTIPLKKGETVHIKHIK